MPDPGEEIVGEYLRLCLGCDFVEYNLHTKALAAARLNNESEGCDFVKNNLHKKEVQGEIDVVGINTKDKIVYICEVATHLQTGLQYTKNRRPDNIDRLTGKFAKDIRYTNKYYSNYKKHFMLWSPIVKALGPRAERSQMDDVEQIKSKLASEFKVDLELVINQEYDRRLKKLRKYAAEETKALKSPILRLMQIEEKLRRHVEKLDLSSSSHPPSSTRPSSRSVAISPARHDDPPGGMMTPKKIAMLVGLFLSKFSLAGCRRLGFRTFTAAYESIGQTISIKLKTINNYRDEFDPLFHDNGRVGWKPDEPRRPPILEMYEEYGGLALNDFANLIEQRLTEYANHHHR